MRISNGPRIFWDDGLQEYSKFVDPARNRDKYNYPYSYDPFWIWRLDDKDSPAEYSDRLAQRDYAKFQECTKLVAKRFDQYSNADLSKFLTAYFGRPIEATALAEGCNQSNGYPYWIFYFREKKKEKKAKKWFKPSKKKARK